MTLWAPGVPGCGGGAGSGAVIAVRGGLGFCQASETVIVEGRAVAAVIHVPGCSPFVAVSIHHT
eukprot:1926082-Pyramimonas_sp.AAC.1